MVDFFECLREFAQAKDLSKFSLFSSNVFSNGKHMGAWFASKKDFIMDFEDAECLKVQEQYREYLKSGKQNITFSDGLDDAFRARLIEFTAEPDLTKFTHCSAPLFASGAHMGTWFTHNKRLIELYEHELCWLIRLQYLAFESGEGQNVCFDELLNVMVSNMLNEAKTSKTLKRGV